MAGLQARSRTASHDVYQCAPRLMALNDDLSETFYALCQTQATQARRTRTWRGGRVILQSVRDRFDVGIVHDT